MKKYVRKMVLLAIILIIGISVWAQGPPPPPGFTDDTEDASSGGSGGGTGSGTGGTGSSGSLPAIPIDGGLSLLLAAGVTYGAKRRIRN